MIGESVCFGKVNYQQGKTSYWSQAKKTCVKERVVADENIKALFEEKTTSVPSLQKRPCAKGEKLQAAYDICYIHCCMFSLKYKGLWRGRL